MGPGRRKGTRIFLNDVKLGAGDRICSGLRSLPLLLHLWLWASRTSTSPNFTLRSLSSIVYQILSEAWLLSKVCRCVVCHPLIDSHQLPSNQTRHATLANQQIMLQTRPEAVVQGFSPLVFHWFPSWNLDGTDSQSPFWMLEEGAQRRIHNASRSQTWPADDDW